jgi:hypothetical protein
MKPGSVTQPKASIRPPLVYPTKEPAVGVDNVNVRTSPAASSIANGVKATEKIPIAGFVVNGPTLGENPVAVTSAEMTVPVVLFITMSPPSVEVGLQASA